MEQHKQTVETPQIWIWPDFCKWPIQHRWCENRKIKANCILDRPGESRLQTCTADLNVSLHVRRISMSNAGRSAVNAAQRTWSICVHRYLFLYRLLSLIWYFYFRGFSRHILTSNLLLASSLLMHIFLTSCSSNWILLLYKPCKWGKITLCTES